MDQKIQTIIQDISASLHVTGQIAVEIEALIERIDLTALEAFKAGMTRANIPQSEEALAAFAKYQIDTERTGDCLITAWIADRENRSV
jgi:hypothetical protein